ncbi:hypothetical protein GQ55_4G350000 [Panicum hallii var. hallii]|uniref:Uncharacterized protein n=1 Tax=Panicum hallii var. hallii TaxID=1504633 RepID=A0A2T7E3E1_9POAL|nr:hypothetical protein GQ55_4G350000 [Panicum hallii var. hallii]
MADDTWALGLAAWEVTAIFAGPPGAACFSTADCAGASGSSEGSGPCWARATPARRRRKPTSRSSTGRRRATDESASSPCESQELAGRPNGQGLAGRRQAAGRIRLLPNKF